MSSRLSLFRRAPAAPARPAPRQAPGAGVPGASADGAAGAGGDSAAARQLIAPHIDAAYSLARYLARDVSAAEDIAQEALLKACRNLASLRGGAVRPWLLAIVRNAYFDWRRREGGGRFVSGPAAELVIAETADETHSSAEDALVRAGDIAALRAAIEVMPEPFREALVLRDLEDLSYREIAEVTGAPMGTVMSRISRARGMLAVRMGVAEAVR